MVFSKAAAYQFLFRQPEAMLDGFWAVALIPLRQFNLYVAIFAQVVSDVKGH